MEINIAHHQKKNYHQTLLGVHGENEHLVTVSLIHFFSLCLAVYSICLGRVSYHEQLSCQTCKSCLQRFRINQDVPGFSVLLFLLHMTRHVPYKHVGANSVLMHAVKLQHHAFIPTYHTGLTGNIRQIITRS